MTSNWLTELVRRAEQEQMCVRLGCTTCGAIEFKNLLMMAMIREFPELRVAGREFGSIHADCLLSSLAELKLETDAIMELVYLCWYKLGGDDAVPRMRQVLANTRAGHSLERMIAHEQSRKIARAEHAQRNDPVEVKRMRELKKLERQQRHEARKQYYRELWQARRRDPMNKD